MDDELIKDIIVSILSKNETFNEIHRDTSISPRIVRKYLEHMKNEGLIEEDEKNWKQGKNKKCSATEKGIEWLIDVALFDFLKTLSSLFENRDVLKTLKNPKNREMFQKLKKKRYAETISVARKHFIECAQKGVDPFEEIRALDEWEYKKKFKILDMEKPLLEAFERLNILIAYLNSDISWDEIVRYNNTLYHIFSPHMRHWFSYLPGSNKKIDSYFVKIWDEFRKTNQDTETG